MTTWVGTAVAVGATVELAVGAVVAVATAAFATAVFAAALLLPLVLAEVVSVVLLAAVAAGVGLTSALVLERLSRKACTVAVELTWATSTADPLEALITTQPPTVAASEAEVSRILTV